MIDRVVVEQRRVTVDDVAVLDRREAAALSTRVTTRRRAEFATGRVCARRALGRLLGASPESLAVLRSADGVPVAAGVRARTSVPVHVSITHADGFAMAAASHAPVGIDLVTVENHGRAFRDDAFEIRELEAWRRWSGQDDVFASCVAFAAKEAAFKCLRGAAWAAVRPGPAHEAEAPEGLTRPCAFSASITARTRQLPWFGTGRGWVAAVRADQVAVALTVTRDATA